MRLRTPLPVAAAIAAAVLIIGGASAAIALYVAGHKPPAPQSSPDPAHSAPARHGTTSKASPSAAPVAKFKVCTLPAVTCASGGAAYMKSEPAKIITSADGSGYVEDLQWSDWGKPTAQGTGILEVDDCNPNCAEGTYTGYHATMRLSGITPYGNQKQAYADMVISAPSAPYPPQAFRAGLVP